MNEEKSELIDSLVDSINRQKEVVEAYEAGSNEAEKASLVLKNQAEAYAKVVEAETKRDESKTNIWCSIAKTIGYLGLPVIGFLFIGHENQVARRWESDGNYVASQTSKNAKSFTDGLLRDLFKR